MALTRWGVELCSNFAARIAFFNATLTGLPSGAEGSAKRKPSALWRQALTRRAVELRSNPIMCRVQERDPNGIRTRVTAVKGRCPRPLDDRVRKERPISRAHPILARDFPGNAMPLRT